MTLSNRAADAIRAGAPEKADFLTPRLVNMALLCYNTLFPYEFPELAAEPT